MSDVGKTVLAIQGNPVKREILGSGQDGYVLTWDGINEQWKAEQPSSPTSFVPGGDLTGTSVAQYVQSLSGANNTGTTISIAANVTTLQCASQDSVIFRINGPNATTIGNTGSNIQIMGGNANSPNGTTAGGGNVTLQGGIPDSGSGAPFGDIFLSGSRTFFQSCMVFNVTQINSDYTISALSMFGSGPDFIIAIGSLSGPINLTMPAIGIQTGMSFFIKDINGTISSTNTVTIHGNGENIDGNSTLVLTMAYSSTMLTLSGGSGWMIMTYQTAI